MTDDYPQALNTIKVLDMFDPEVTIGLDEQLRRGIAAQLRVLADLIDPPK